MKSSILLGIPSLFLAACDGDSGLKRFLEPPVVAIESPVEGAELDEAVPVLMRGRVADEAFSDSLGSISASWAIDGGSTCTEAVFDENGLTECETTFNAGPVTVSLTATNPDAQTANAVVELSVAVNEAPTAQIVEPSAGGEYFASELVVFDGLVEDGEDRPEEMTVVWTSSIDGDLPIGTTPGSDGKSQGTALLSAGEHQISLIVTDSTGRTGSALTTIVVEVGGKPSIELVSPVSGDSTNVDEAMYFEAFVSDGEDDPEDVLLSWESSLDGVFSAQSASSDGTASFSYTGLTMGTHTITVYATDSDGMSALDSATLYVNGVPSAPTVHIEPDPTTSSDALSVVVDAASIDPDGDPLTYDYSWFLNGVATAYVSNPLPASATTRGDLWTVYVTPDDGETLGPAGSASITIQNSPPTMSGISISPTTAYTDDTLSAVATGFVDDDGDTEGWRYQWALNGTDLSGETDATLVGSAFVKGDSLVVTAWPYDGRELGAGMSSSARVIQNSTPSTPVVDVSPGSPERDDTLTCTASSSDADGDAVSLSYSWLKNGSATGLTETTVDASYTENGESWTCSVTASDGTATSVAGTDTVLVDDYVNVPPEAPTIHIEPSPALSDETLAAIIDVDSYDHDGDVVTYAYAWYRDGVLTAVTTDTVPASQTTRGEIWTVQVTPHDGTQYGSAETAAVNIENTPPTVVSAAISPSTAYTDSTLSVTLSGYADDDADPASYVYQWYRGGVAISGAIDATLAGSNFVVGDVVSVEVTPWDGYDMGAAVTSGSVTIQNSSPTTPLVEVLPASPEREQSLYCSYASTDADGETLSYTVSWTKDGAPTSITGATVDASYTDNGETWTCSVSASDGTATSSVGHDTVVVDDYVNVPPGAPTIHVDPDPPQSDESLTAVVDVGSTDTDGDPISYAYLWYKNGVSTSIVTATVPASQTTRGEVWTVRVTPNDGHQDGTSASASVTITNTPPTLTRAAISPSTAYTNDTLTAVPTGFADDDGDAADYLYQWYKGSAAISGATDSTLVGSHFVKGDSIYVVVTPWDGTEAGPSATSSSITIQNSTPATPTVDVTPNTPEREDDLLCTYSSTDADGDTLSYSLSWLKDGAPSGVTGTSVDDAFTENGQVWTCVITASDGTISSGSGSDSVTVDDYVNVAPAAPTVSISPDPARSDQALAVTVDVGSYDLDGDTISYTYAWYKNGSATGLTSSSVAASYTTRGEVWSVVVTPYDGHQTGSTATDSVTIGNTAPTISSVSITPTSAYTNDTLTGVPAGYADDDGDAASYRYQWYLGGSAISGATSSTLSGTYFSKGDVLTVAVTPWDGTELGTSVTSSSLTVLNSAPSTPGVSVTPTFPEDGDALTCTVATVSSDADGDSVSYTYRWTVNGVASALSSSSVAASYTSNGQTWACYVSASDGSASSAEGSDSSLVGDYTAPAAPVLATLSPYRNESTIVVSGTAEAFATITLYQSCGSGISSTTGIATGAGSFSFSISSSAGASCSFYATATDSSGNISAVSNIVSTEVCDPDDDYEDLTAYGDSCSDPVVGFSVLTDAGTTSITFTGNILDGSDEDWYKISTSDLATAGINYYRMHIEMLAGSSEYAFAVYEGGCASANLDCGLGGSDPEGNGYVEYDFYAQDVGDGGHAIPGETRSCTDSHGSYNNCEDLSSDYYVHVFRTTSDYSCGEYTLYIDNGVW